MIMSLTLDDKALQSVIDALPRQVFNAQRSAIGTTVTFARKELQKRMIAKTGIPARVFRRVRIKATRRPESGSVWLGYNPVKATYVGKLKQDPAGAFAGDYFFEGGFVARLQSGHVGIFKRGTELTRNLKVELVEQTVDLGIGVDVAEEVYGLAQIELRRRFTERMRALNPHLE